MSRYWKIKRYGIGFTISEDKEYDYGVSFYDCVWSYYIMVGRLTLSFTIDC